MRGIKKGKEELRGVIGMGRGRETYLQEAVGKKTAKGEPTGGGARVGHLKGELGVPASSKGGRSSKGVEAEKKRRAKRKEKRGPCVRKKSGLKIPREGDHGGEGWRPAGKTAL